MDKILKNKLLPIIGMFLTINSIIIFWYSNQISPTNILIKNEEAICYAKKPYSHSFIKLISIIQIGLGLGLIYKEWKNSKKSIPVIKSKENANDIKEYTNDNKESIDDDSETFNFYEDYEGEEDYEKITDKYPWFQHVLEYPSILLYGIPGSGKSTFLKNLAEIRKERGHKIIAIDPHQAKGDWSFCDYTIGSKLNYQEIEEEFNKIEKLIQKRYGILREEGPKNFRPITYFVEELTNFTGKVSNSEEIFRKSLSDFRKINLKIVYVSHGRNLKNLGAKAGSGELRQGLLELNLKASPGKEGEATPMLKGTIKIPGEDKLKEIKIPTTEEFKELKRELKENQTKTLIDSKQGRKKVLPTTEEEKEFLHEQCVEAYKMNCTKSFIIQNILGCKAERYKKGAEFLDELEQKYGALEDAK